MRLQAALFQHVTRARLAYSSCWEDPTLDEQALHLNFGDRVLAITSAGCNVLHYLLCGAGKVHAVDCNPCQSHLLELKMAGIQSLDYESFFELFGSGGGRHAGQMYFDAMRPALTAAAARYWDRNLHRLSGTDWRGSFYHKSTSGTAYWLMMQYLNRVTGLRPEIERLLSAKDLESQQALYERSGIRRELESPVVRWLLSQGTLSSMMAIPADQRVEASRSYPGGWVAFALDRIDLVFRRTLIRRNHHWYVALTGRYERDCCPSYLQPDAFLRLKGGLLDRLRVRTATVAEYLASTRHRFTKYVLLDHMDWMSGGHDAELEREWSEIVRTATPDARIIFRSAAADPSYLARVRVMGRPLADVLRPNQQLATRLHALDPVCLYGSLHIADLATISADAQ